MLKTMKTLIIKDQELKKQFTGYSIKNLSQLKKHLKVGTVLYSQWSNSNKQLKRTVKKVQTNGVYLTSTRSTGLSFMDLNSAKDFNFLDNNIVELYLDNDLAVTYYL